VVLVQAAKNRAAIVGNVIRPGIYELSDKGTVRELVDLAGGARFNTDLRRVHVERVIPLDEREKYEKDLRDIDLKFPTMADFKKDATPLIDGDVVSVLKMSDLPENRVHLTGSVRKPGPFEFKPGMRISESDYGRGQPEAWDIYGAWLADADASKPAEGDDTL